MKMRLLAQFIYLTSVGCSIAATTPHSSHSHFDWNETNFFLAFGDSYTYVQGTYGRQNYSFIGDEQNYNVTPVELLSNEIIQNQTSTSAGGPNWVEYLTGCFSGLPSKCSKQLWDFAFAGADVSSTQYTPPHHPFTVSLASQITQWSTYARPFLPAAHTMHPLVAIWIGINDISDTATTIFPTSSNLTSFSALYTTIVTTEFASLSPLYSAGYRTYLIPLLPPLERTPPNILLGPSKARPNATMVAAYNTAIRAAAARFEAEHRGARVLVFDTYTFLSSILDHPAEYGIRNTTGYCPDYDAPDISTDYAKYGCLPIADYFWYNTGHVTYRVHQLLAEEMETFLEAESYWREEGEERW